MFGTGRQSAGVSTNESLAAACMRVASPDAALSVGTCLFGENGAHWRSSVTLRKEREQHQGVRWLHNGTPCAQLTFQALRAKGRPQAPQEASFSSRKVSEQELEWPPSTTAPRSSIKARIQVSIERRCSQGTIECVGTALSGKPGREILERSGDRTTRRYEYPRRTFARSLQDFWQMHGHISWESLCAGAVLVCEQQTGGVHTEEDSSRQAYWTFWERDFCRAASAIAPVWSEENGFGVGCIRTAKAGDVLHELRPQIAVAAHAGVGKICVNCFRELPTTRRAATGRKAQQRQSYRESTCSDACTDAQATIAAVRALLQQQFEQQFPKAMQARMLDLCTLVLRLFLPTDPSNLVQSQEFLAMALSLERHTTDDWDQDTLLALTTAAHAVWEAIRGADPSVAPLVSVLSGPAHIVLLLQACAINAQPLGDVLCLDELLARINHSCAPNAYLHMTGHGAGMRVKLRAISDIKKGEQVTVAYFSELVQEVEHRRALLNEAFHFDCRCKRCTTEGARHKRACLFAVRIFSPSCAMVWGDRCGVAAT